MDCTRIVRARRSVSHVGIAKTKHEPQNLQPTCHRLPPVRPRRRRRQQQLIFSGPQRVQLPSRSTAPCTPATTPGSLRPAPPPLLEGGLLEGGESGFTPSRPKCLASAWRPTDLEQRDEAGGLLKRLDHRARNECGVVRVAAASRSVEASSQQAMEAQVMSASRPASGAAARRTWMCMCVGYVGWGYRLSRWADSLRACVWFATRTVVSAQRLSPSSASAMCVLYSAAAIPAVRCCGVGSVGGWIRNRTGTYLTGVVGRHRYEDVVPRWARAPSPAACRA